MQYLVRKLLTRPIHHFETRRTYHIREKIFSLPPYKIQSASVTTPEITVVVQTTSRSATDAAWAARSILSNLSFPASLIFVLDGDFINDSKQNLLSAFPGAKFMSTSDIVSFFKEDSPWLYRLAQDSPVGRKLLSILYLQTQISLIFSDPDVLCFSRMLELEESIRQHRPGCYIQEGGGKLHADAGTLDSANRLSFPCAHALNSGFLYSHRNTLDSSYAEQILALGISNNKSWFIEQTLLAILMEIAEATPLPSERYVVSGQRQFYFEGDVDYNNIAARHFVSTVRHLMYMKGMPRLWSQWKQSTSSSKGQINNDMSVGV